MLLYEPGDVVWLPYPFEEEGSLEVKFRPGVILKEGERLSYAIIQVTTNKDKAKTNKGILVEVNSERGLMMGLLEDSFINLERIEEIDEGDIYELMGCVDEDCFDQIEMLLAS